MQRGPRVLLSRSAAFGLFFKNVSEPPYNFIAPCHDSSLAVHTVLHDYNPLEALAGYCVAPAGYCVAPPLLVRVFLLL